MKQPMNPVLKEERLKYFSDCLICGKKILEGFYGRWGEGGTCSKKCEIEKESQPKLHGGKLCSFT